jgi:hypothetical protein
MPGWAKGVTVKTDAQMMDWLNEQSEKGCVTMCFEIDGGVHVTLDGVGDARRAARNANTIRDGIAELMPPSETHEVNSKCRCQICDGRRYALSGGIVLAIEYALKFASPAAILDENSPIKDAMREFIELMPPNAI